jgi:RND family efflux transporter MFP subunit
MASRTRRTSSLLSFVMGIAAAGCNREAPPPPQAAAPKVTVAHPEERELVDQDEYNGWLAASQSVDVRARVRGHIQKVNFTDGQLVKKDDLLFTLDKRPFQAQVNAALAQVRVYQAMKVAADKEFIRLRDLLGKGGASQSQVDKAEADAGALDAQIEAAKEDAARHQLDLEYSSITAPIAGRVSRALLTEGNLVNAGGSDPVLTSLVSIDPVYVYFNVDERALQRYMKARRAGGQERPSSVKEQKIPFSFALESDEGFPHQGVLNFADNKVDPDTGTIQVRGEVPDPGQTLVPGSRVRVRVPVSNPYRAILVPDTALLTDQDRKYALVIGDKDVVLRRDIRPGKLLDDGMRVALASGKEAALKKDEWVIVLGLQRARVNYPVAPLDAEGKPIAGPGAKVPKPEPAITPAVGPAAEPAAPPKSAPKES